jgi:uncharacterized protein (UPF0261 family)
MATVALLGTLDTKGEECAYLGEELVSAGCDVVLIDGGVLGEPTIVPDVTRAEVRAAAGVGPAPSGAPADRRAALETMARGAGEILTGMFASGTLHGVIGVGGSSGSSLAALAMQGLPVGLPKVVVSTMASGDTRPYVGTSDITMMHSIVDIAGLNAILKQILGNAAAATAGMAKRFEVRGLPRSDRPLIGATMFGVTTDCVTAARRVLEGRGYEVLVFHATGTGGRAMERLVADGHITGVLDVTPTELVDDLVGGVLSAGPDRLEAAGRLGIPQVVSLGALDIGNFGPMDAVPERYRHRNLLAHNHSVTLMRTTAEESARLGKIVAEKLNGATGAVTVFVPRRGTSAIATEGGPFHDPAADDALIGELLAGLDASIEVVEMDTHINDPAFGRAMADALDRHHRAWSGGPDTTENQQPTEQKGGTGIGVPI